MFALAEEGWTVFFSNECFWCEAGVFVSAIAKRLVVGLAAGAKEVFLAGFELDFYGVFGGDMWLIGHDSGCW